MKKRILVIIMGIIFVLNTTHVNIEAAASLPSSWAEEEVNNAITENMVPATLKNNYQYNIKRYEYVLIALQLLDLNNDQVTITQKYPFYDIYGHEYEDEIVKAYNAGIINGNGDGTFRPDDLINRQEISALVVNLVKRLQNVTSVNTSSWYTYSDASDISSWAIEYINYCYNNKIMNGVGKDANGLDKINPKGQATREQAIILLYRLSNYLESSQPSDLASIDVVKYTDDNGGQTSEASTVINDFAKVLGQPLAKKLIQLSKLDNIEIIDLSEDFVQINVINEGVITIADYGFGVDLKLRLNDLSLDHGINTYIELGRLINDNELLGDIVYRDINMFESDVTHSFNENLSKDEKYNSYAENIEGVYWYTFTCQFESN